MEKSDLENFLTHSFELLHNYPQGERYYHTLQEGDNSPVVIHDYTNQLTYIVKGSGVAYLNGLKQKVRDGSIVLIEAGTTHRFVAEPGGLTMLHVHIPDSGRDNDRRVVEGDDYNRYTVG